MPIEFVRETCTAYGHYTVCDSTKLVMAYDGSGRRVSKTRMKKTAFDGPWYADLVTHYTGIGTEIRENMPGGTLKDVRVVVNMPQGLGRYGIEDAADAFRGVPLDENGKPTSWSALNPKFEWYLKNHLGSTMLVYGTQWADHENLADVGAPIAAYDYRSFGEQVTLAETADKVTENFTGKERDDETQLDYFGARYLDPMLGMWTSVDPMRQFASPYLYAGNGMNPLNVVDPDGEAPYQIGVFLSEKEMQNKEQADDFSTAEEWGREKFGNDFEIKVIRKESDMIEFVKQGRFTAIIGHTWKLKGKLYNDTRRPAASLDLRKLDKEINRSGSYAKVFGCNTGLWNLMFYNVEYGDNKGKLPMGIAYKAAGLYLLEERDYEQKMMDEEPSTEKNE
ncbi:MAG: RHS repeat-associated core domain-containing protein [Bacteroidales bacterium]|nr:RHS repeat-associated core domain-containing protein [Bacteroidales bacterium]